VAQKSPGRKPWGRDGAAGEALKGEAIAFNFELQRRIAVAQSLSNVLVHFVFSTKDRFSFLTDPEIRRRMHGYLACVFTDEDCPAIEAGGTSDHVHVLCSLSRSHSMSEVIRKAKANSWAKSLGGMLSKFNWQGGYGAFSVHPSQAGQVQNYIRNQQEHHRVRSFQDEYFDFLREYQVPYDERYIWT
jgi:REP element-mobilizing transposase RayT